MCIYVYIFSTFSYLSSTWEILKYFNVLICQFLLKFDYSFVTFQKEWEIASVKKAVSPFLRGTIFFCVKSMFHFRFFWVFVYFIQIECVFRRFSRKCCLYIIWQELWTVVNNCKRLWTVVKENNCERKQL